MSSVAEHYETHLAPIYVWMAGGFDAAIARGRAEVDAVCPRPSSDQWAVDLGAGFGMHAIPLADIGYSVLAIDSSSLLLDVINDHVDARSITTIHGDLLSFTKYLDSPAALFVCMGDTLTHLPNRHSIEQLCADVAKALARDGLFIVSFRDYSTALMGLKRFIPVRSDPGRILTCFLEYGEEAVTVHDILYERRGAEWRQHISSYRKLRLSPEWLTHTLEDKGLQVTRELGLSGMVRLIAKRPP